MTSFLAGLKEERSTLVPLTASVPADLVTRADAAQREAREFRDRRNAVGIYAPSDEQDRLDAAAVELRNQVTALQQAKDRATTRIRELDRLLTADDHVQRAKRALSDNTKAGAERRLQLQRLSEVEEELHVEIGALEREEAESAKQQATASLRSRMDGRPADAPLDTDTVARDLVSRKATLVAAKRAMDELRTSLAALADERTKLRSRFLDARGRVAELALLERLPSVLPIVAEMVACRGTLSTLDLIDMVDREAVRVARQKIDAEIDAPTAAAVVDVPDRRKSPNRNSTTADRVADAA